MSVPLAVLYIEDDPLSREVMELVLSEIMGLSDFAIFPNSEDFLAKIDQLPFKPNMILLDIHVEPYSGFEMLKMLRDHAEYKYLPIIALTASVMNEEVNQLKTSGFNSIVAKPIDLEAFPSILNRVIEGESVWYVIS